MRLTTDPEPARPLDADEATPLFAEILHEAFAIDAAQPRTPEASCLIAVSGGPDSIALMHLAALAAPSLPAIRFQAATVDHGLRPQSRQEALAVGEQARALGMEHHVLQWEGEKPTSGVQEAAREARYRLLRACAARIGAVAVMTAHTRDDQAETVLMRLTRGSGVDGLAGMRRVTPLGEALLLRPFLDIPKSRLLATCAANGWDYVVDPSNENPAFGRVRIRRILETLAPEGLTAERLARLAERAREASDALDACAERAFDETLVPPPAEDRIRLDGEKLAREPREILRRVLARGIECLAPEGGASGYGPRRDRFDALCGAVAAALDRKAPLPARSLGRIDIAVDAAGRVVLRRSAPRREPAEGA